MMSLGDRLNSLQTWTQACLALCALAAVTASAHGQFSGPAVSASTLPTPRTAPTSDPAILYPAPQDVRIGTGDLLSIRLFLATDYESQGRVSIDGSILLPLIGVVHVEGLTVLEAETLISKRLTDAGMYKNPQITLQITESVNQFVTVTGEVHAIIPLQGQRRLFDVLAAATGATGGVAGAGGTSASSSHIITILRPSVKDPIVVDIGTDAEQSAKADIPILPRDTIVISRVGVVYMIGAFKTQGQIPLAQNAPLTLMEAASISGGVGWEGRNNDLRIIRTVGAERKEIRVDMKRILNGKDPDPVLQAQDIVFFPAAGWKAAIKSGGIATVLGIAQILIYTSINL